MAPVNKPKHKGKALVAGHEHMRVKQNELCFIQKDTHPNQKCSGGSI